MSFTKVNPTEIDFNPFSKIGGDWMLLTAGTKDSFNTMTASWGGVGVMWNKNVLTAVVRPSRYTCEFMDREEYFTASFFSPENKDALTFCGRHSGRDTDKVAETGLTPVFLDGAPSFEQAKLVLVCKKLYRFPLDKDGITEKSVLSNYKEDELMHIAFVGEIVGCYEA